MVRTKAKVQDLVKLGLSLQQLVSCSPFNRLEKVAGYKTLYALKDRTTHRELERHDYLSISKHSTHSPAFACPSLHFPFATLIVLHLHCKQHLQDDSYSTFLVMTYQKESEAFDCCD